MGRRGQPPGFGRGMTAREALVERWFVPTRSDARGG